jgi:succinate dehydrogenase/fumarate reductase flavoprotein subunit
VSAEHEWDVVVVGAGAAGLTAATSAAEAGARVLLFESESEVGGSLNQSAGMFMAAGTSVQNALGVDDNPSRFFQHYMDLNQWRLQRSLVWSFCEQATETFEWLLTLGVEVPARWSSDAHTPGLCRSGVEDLWRGHVPVGDGYGLVRTLAGAVRERLCDLVLNTRVERLLVEGGRVVGVVADGEEVLSPAVVVTTGGLARDPELVARYVPDAEIAGPDLFVVAGAGSRGDHIRFAKEADAQLTGLGAVLMVLPYFQRHHHWQAGFPPLSRVNVNSAGQRFMDEDLYPPLAAGVLAHQAGPVWVIFDEAGRLTLDPGYADWTPLRILEEVETGRLARAADLGDLARQLGVPAPVLIATIERWNNTLTSGFDPEFSRELSLNAKSKPLPAKISTPPYYAAQLLPTELVVTYTGIQIDSHARALDARGEVIPGLYAAGEAGGGVLGNTYVGSGLGISNAITMGRRAGITAAQA